MRVLAHRFSQSALRDNVARLSSLSDDLSNSKNDFGGGAFHAQLIQRPFSG